MSGGGRIIQNLLHSSRRLSARRLCFLTLHTHALTNQNPCSLSRVIDFSLKPTSLFSSSFTLRFLSTPSIQDKTHNQQEDSLQYDTTTEDGETTDGWEEEDEVEAKIGDGGDGGGVVLQDVPWGEQALSIAHEVLLQFGDDMKLYSFKTTPRGYVYVRLDKLSNEYGCPSMEELENYSQGYKKRLDEAGALGEIPDDLALEVSTPGAERILKVPDDLGRFEDMPMRVCYVEDVEANCSEKNGVFMLESVEVESENCVWKLADVKENREPQSKGRPLSRKQRDWRLKLPFAMHKKELLAFLLDGLREDLNRVNVSLM